MVKWDEWSEALSYDAKGSEFKSQLGQPLTAELCLLELGKDRGSERKHDVTHQ